MLKTKDSPIRNKNETLLIAGCLFGYVVSGICSMALGSLLPFFRETYGLSYDDSGLLLSLQSAGNMVSVLLMGFLPSFLGRRRSVLVTGVWMSAAYLIFSTGLGGALLLPAACFMTGIARGGNSNFGNTMMSTLPGEKPAAGYNLLHGSYAAGALAAPLLIILFTGKQFSGWRGAAAVLLALTVLQLTVYGKIPLPQEPHRGTGRVDYRFFKKKNFWFGALILFFYLSAEYAITGWLVTYFQDIGILSANLSQMMSSLLWSVMFIGRLLGAAASGKVSCRVLLGIDGLGLLGFFLLVYLSRTAVPVIIGIAGVGLSMATVYPSAMALANDSIRGNDFGVSAMALTGSIGGILTPAAVGLVAERSGIHSGMRVVVLMTVLLLAVIAAAIFSKEGTET